MNSMETIRIFLHRSFRLMLLVAFVTAFAGCGAEPAVEAEPTPIVAGGETPTDVARSFLVTLHTALSDPELGEVEVRQRWIDALTNHFAPNERVDQQRQMTVALGGYVRGLRQRDPSRARLRLELLLERVELVSVSEDGQMAVVRPVQARMVLLYQTDRGFEEAETIELSKLIGREDLPVKRVGDRWFLTEG
jgi:hypothetical protein